MFPINPELKRIQEERDKAHAARQSRPDSPPPRGVELHVSSLENTYSKAEVEGFTFFSDEPIEGGGTGKAPAPLRYFYGGVMLCTNVWFVKGCALTGVGIESLESKMKFLAGPTVEIEMSVRTKESNEAMVGAAKIARTRCPAYKNLEIAQPIHFRLVSNDEVVLDETTPAKGMTQ